MRWPWARLLLRALHDAQPVSELRSVSPVPRALPLALGCSRWQPHLPQTKRTQSPLTGTAPTCCAPLPLSDKNLRTASGSLKASVRPISLIGCPPSRPSGLAAASGGSCVTEAPKKKLENWHLVSRAVVAPCSRHFPAPLCGLGGEAEVPKPLLQTSFDPARGPQES